jgi:hypothetical protein
VKLLDSLLSELVKRGWLYGTAMHSDGRQEWVSKVCVSCSVTLAI